MLQNKQKYIYGFILCVATIFSLWAFWAGTFMPHLQMQTYIKYAFMSSSRDFVPDNSFIFANYPYSQFRIFQDVLSFASGADKNYPNSLALSEQAIAKMTDFLTAHPHYPLFYGMLGRAYDNMAIQTGDISFFEKAEESYARAVELSPKRQEFHYMYAMHFVAQGKSEEAIDILRQALSLDEQVPDSHFYLGATLLSLGEENYKEALDHLEYALDNDSGAIPNNSVIKDSYSKLLLYFYKQKDIASFTNVLKRLSLIDPSGKELYEQTIKEISTTGKIPNFNLGF